jgi:hypothetical protein
MELPSPSLGTRPCRRHCPLRTDSERRQQFVSPSLALPTRNLRQKTSSFQIRRPPSVLDVVACREWLHGAGGGGGGGKKKKKKKI